MKSLYSITLLLNRFLQQIVPVKKIMALIVVSLLSLATFAIDDDDDDDGITTSTRLDFRYPRLESGVALSDGAVYRFDKVDKYSGEKIDCLVKIVRRSDALVAIKDLDMDITGHKEAFQPQVMYNNGTTPGPADWFMEFEFTFVKKGTNTPAVVNYFDVTALDIDGNGAQINEWVAFFNLDSYILESNSALGITTLFEDILGILTPKGNKFTGPTWNAVNIDTLATSVMTTNRYTARNSFKMQTGATSTAVNGAADRMYSMYFKSFSFNAPMEIFLATTLTSFNANLEDKGAELNWSTTSEKNLSHYTIERSVNGIDFYQAAMVIANASGDVNNDYSYTDKINTNVNGIIYYRLRMTDMDGKFKYSATRVIRLGEQKQTMTVSVYPNPVVNELRIMIPQSWQDKKVTFALYNSNGQVVRQVVNNRAGQTEVLQVNGIVEGVYFIKAATDNETAVQRILKSK